MNFIFSLTVALSTPAFAADIDLPKPLITPEAVSITLQEPEREVKPQPSDLPKWKESACNCYNLLKETFDHVPPMNQMIATAKHSHPNPNVAVFKYPATSEWPEGIPHVALVRQIHPDGSIDIEEYNYKSCNHSFRTIPPAYPRLLGFVSL